MIWISISSRPWMVHKLCGNLDWFRRIRSPSRSGEIWNREASWPKRDNNLDTIQNMFLCFLPIILRPSSSSWLFGNLYENMVCNKEIFITPILLNLEIVFVLSVRFGAPLPSPLHSNLVNNFSMLCVPILYFSSSLLKFVSGWKAGINEKVAVCLSCSFYPQEEYSALR